MIEVKHEAHTENWKTGYFQETDSVTGNVSQVIDKNNHTWIHGRKWDNGDYEANIFKRDEGVSKLSHKIVIKNIPYKQYLTVIQKDGEQLVCDCGCHTFRELCKQRPLHVQMQCLNCYEIHEVYDY